VGERAKRTGVARPGGIVRVEVNLGDETGQNDQQNADENSGAAKGRGMPGGVFTPTCGRSALAEKQHHAPIRNT